VFPNYSRLPAIVSCGHQSTGLGDENVSGSEQSGKSNEANDDTPEYAGPLFLNCCLKHK